MFLAACDTLVAESARGDDIYGLADAFIAAGSSSVVATLWSINPEASTRYAEEYYVALWSGSSEPEALAAADRQFLGERASAEFAKPFFWAAFSVLSPLQFLASDQQTTNGSAARADAMRERTAQALETAVGRVNMLISERDELKGKLDAAESANKNLGEKIAKLKDDASKAADRYFKTREEADKGKKASEELGELKKSFEQVRQALIGSAAKAELKARVFGTVVDRYGKLMGGAKLTITDLDAAEKDAAPRQAESNDAAEYSVSGLAIGHRYKIKGTWTHETKTTAGNIESTDTESRHDETDEFVLSGDSRIDITFRGVNSFRYSGPINDKGVNNKGADNKGK